MPQWDEQALRQQAAEATAAGSKSFYFASRFFPEDLSRSAHAVYWFCRTTDDLVDEAPSLEVGRTQIGEWAAALDDALRLGQSPNPVLHNFALTAQRCGIPHEYARELVAGVRMDLGTVRYRDFAELRLFCYRVASTVGLMMSHVIGFRPPALDHAIDLGIAMQLTNILRDVGEDLGRDRIYLPLDEMAAAGYSEHELRRSVRNEAFRRLMQQQARRARAYYRSSLPGIALLDPRGRFAVRIAADVYHAILTEIERADYDVFTRRAVVASRRKYWISARSLAGPILRQGWARLAGAAQ